MRVAAAAVLLGVALQSGSRVAPEPRYFRFEREVQLPAGATGTVCARLDAGVYAHASPALADVRLFSGTSEVPYALTISETRATDEVARILNMQRNGSQIDFDLEMPQRPYSKVNLKLDGRDFIATAKVTGLDHPGDAGKFLGTFTLFDLSSQQLWRDTSLVLGESEFPFLHVDLAIRSASKEHAPEVQLQDAEVPASRESETLYTTLAETDTVDNRSDATVATFDVPARVPVERVSFVLDDDDRTNFSRVVTVLGKFADDEAAIRAGEGEESIAGRITRVKIAGGIAGAGNEIRDEHLSVPAVLGLNARRAMQVSVAIQNGSAKPLAVRSVKLEMRERRLCFDANNHPVAMYYGDATLTRPLYNYGFQIDEAVVQARLGPEQKNPWFTARPVPLSLMGRYPKLPWMVLLGMVAVLAGVAFRVSSKR